MRPTRLLRVLPQVAVAVLCSLIGGGCGAASSPEHAAFSALQTQCQAKGELAPDGHVVALSSSAMTDAQAQHLTALTALKSLTLSQSPIGDTTLLVIGRLEHLETLLIDQTQVTDAGLLNLSRLKQLRELNLAGCPITDSGLKSLAVLTNLKMLNLNETQIRGPGLTQLDKLTRLESLYLQGTAVDFAGQPPLTGLAALKMLHLARTQVGGGVVRAVAGLAKLERLYLNETQIQDADIPALAAVLADNSPHLKGLFVENTQLSDAALEPLHPLSTLADFTLIHVHGTKITKQGVIRLRGLLPEANVVSQH